MKLFNDRCFDVQILTIALVCLVHLSPWQLASGQTVPAKVSFDGRYVPDTNRKSGEILAGTSVPPCPQTASNTVGQGLIVDNSTATFLVGVQQIGTRKIEPSRVSGKVDSEGNLDISRGMIKVKGHFDGPANSTLGHQNSFV